MGKVDPHLLPLDTQAEQRRAQVRGAAMGRRPSGRDGGREVGENGEEAEGVRFPYSPRAEAVCEGLSTAVGGGG